MSSTKLREKVNSILELRALINIPDGKIIETDSYYGDGKGGGNTFRKVTDTGQADNGGTIIRGTVSGVYEAEYNGVINSKQFGIKSIAEGNTLDVSTDINTGVKWLSDNGGGVYTMSPGEYNIDTYARDSGLTGNTNTDKCGIIVSPDIHFSMENCKFIAIPIYERYGTVIAVGGSNIKISGGEIEGDFGSHISVGTVLSVDSTTQLTMQPGHTIGGADWGIYHEDVYYGLSTVVVGDVITINPNPVATIVLTDLNPGDMIYSGEFGHGISFDNKKQYNDFTTVPSNLEVSNIKLNKCWGDGISGQYYHNISLNNVTCDNNRRQGLTIGGNVNTFSASNSVFTNTGIDTGTNYGTLPKRGVDCEPNTGELIAENINFISCTIKDNVGGGVIHSNCNDFKVFTSITDDVQIGNGTSGTVYSGNTISSIVIAAGENAEATNIVVDGNIIPGTVNLEGYCEDITFSDNDFTRDSNSSYYIRINQAGTDIKNLSFYNNLFKGQVSLSFPFNTSYTTGLIFKGNKFIDCYSLDFVNQVAFQMGAKDLEMTDNTFDGYRGNVTLLLIGASALSGSKNVIVARNNFINMDNQLSSTYCIVCSVNGTTDTNIIIDGNRFDGNTPNMRAIKINTGSFSGTAIVSNNSMMSTTVPYDLAPEVVRYNNITSSTQPFFESPDTKTGTLLNLGNYETNYYNFDGVSTGAVAYTTENIKLGGNVVCLINSLTQPTVDGSSSPTNGSTFIPSTNMHMVVWSPDGINNQFYFLEI